MTPVSMLMTIPVPDPIPLPAPVWLLWFLLMLTFFLHILPMNFVLGGSIVAAVSGGRGRDGRDPHHAELARWMSHAMPVAVAATITLGVAPLLFLQVLYGRLFFTGSVLMGWFWLAVVPLLILAYYGTYLLSFKGEALGPTAGPVRWFTALFFLIIGFFYSNNMSLMLRSEAFGEMYRADARGLHLNLADPTLLPRYLHFLLAAMAVAGMTVAFYGLLRKGKSPEFGTWAMRYGAKWFGIATALNILVGFWFLLALPQEIMSRFMGQSPFATLALALGILLGLGAMIMMFMAINAPDPASLVRGSLGALVLTLVFMVLVRDEVRRAALERVAFETVPWIEPQWGNIGIFAVLLVAAVGTLVWMALAYARSGRLPGDANSP
jgi:hypothetical protein